MNAPRPYVPAGWYENPEQLGEDRWWDGSAWTDAVRPRVVLVERTQEAARRAAPRRRRSDEWRLAELSLMAAFMGCIHWSLPRWDGYSRYEFLIVGVLVSLFTAPAAIRLGIEDRTPWRIVAGLAALVVTATNINWIVERATWWSDLWSW